jgi:trigger factor
MSVKSCEKVEKSQVALTIEVGAAEFEAAIEKAYLKTRKKINVPGFRPGKAPRKVIEGMYGVGVFYDEAINIAFPDAYEAAVKEQELQVVGYPSVELVGEVTREGFTFKATAPVYPEVTLGQYKGLSAEKEEVKVSAADVDERLKQLSDRNTRLVSVEREAKEGDTAIIDFEGFLDGKPFDGGKAENHSLELGSHSFVPGFEEQIVGMKAGDEKEIDITFPENYAPDLAGQAVVFKVKLHAVKTSVPPKIDDEFAKDVSEFDTLDELKQSLKDKLTAQRTEQVEKEYQNAILEQLVSNMTVEVPEAMIAYRTDRMLSDYASRIQGSGMDFNQYLQMMGMTEETLRNDARETATNQIKSELALEAVAEAEKLEVSDEEMEEEVKKLAEQYKMEVDQIKAALSEADLRHDLLVEKANQFVLDNAKVSKAAKKTKAAPAEEPKDAPAEGEEKKPAKKTTKKTTKKAAEAEE